MSIKKTKMIKSTVEYGLLRTVLGIMRLLPYRIAEKFIAKLFLTIGYNFGLRRNLSYQQIKDTFPDKNTYEINKILVGMYRHFGALATDLFLGKDENKTIEIEGWNNITGALDLGRGLLLVSGHIGNWELAGRYIAKQNIPISVVIKRLRNPYVNNLINQLRCKNRMKIIYKKNALKPTLQAFKNNETVVTLIDQDAGKEGVRLPFLGRDASLFTGFTKLAIRNNTPIVFGIALRNKDNSYRFIFEEPILPSSYVSESIHNKDIEIRLAKHFHSRLEHYIHQFPEQWFWMHNRWKRVNKAKVIDDMRAG